MEFPAEARPPEEIDGRLVVLYLGRGHQRGQDNPRLPAIDDVVVVVAKTGSTAARSKRGRIRIRRTGPKVRRSPIGAARARAIRSSHLPDPVVTVGGAVSLFSVGLVRQHDRQGERRILSAVVIRMRSSVIITVVLASALFDEEPGEVRLNRKSRL